MNDVRIIIYLELVAEICQEYILFEEVGGSQPKTNKKNCRTHNASIACLSFLDFAQQAIKMGKKVQ